MKRYVSAQEFYAILKSQLCLYDAQVNALLTAYRGEGGAKMQGKLPVPGRPTIWITVGQGPIALAVGARWDCLDIFTLIYPFFSPLHLFGRRPNVD